MFKRRLAESLRKRMFPNTNLTAKQLASAIQVSDDTIYHWQRAENSADGENVGALVEFFTSQGDPSFVCELFPGVVPLIQKNRKAERALAFVEGFRDVLVEAAA